MKGSAYFVALVLTLLSLTRSAAAIDYDDIPPCCVCDDYCFYGSSGGGIAERCYPTPLNPCRGCDVDPDTRTITCARGGASTGCGCEITIYPNGSKSCQTKGRCGYTV